MTFVQWVRRYNDGLTVWLGSRNGELPNGNELKRSSGHFCRTEPAIRPGKRYPSHLDGREGQAGVDSYLRSANTRDPGISKAQTRPTIHVRRTPRGARALTRTRTRSRSQTTVI